MNIPKILEPLKDQIISSGIESVKIRTSEEKNHINIRSSKMGGYPYLPKRIPYPLDFMGNPMILLAQLNFSDIPNIPGYPIKGLLQFYISTNDVYGLNFENPTSQRDFRILYHSDLDEDEVHTDFLFLENQLSRSDIYPLIEKQYEFSFHKELDFISINDIRFTRYFGQDVFTFFKQFGVDANKIEEDFIMNFHGEGHKIGGYASFTQEDPRNWNHDYEDYILLFQLDSEGDKICWGDVGIGNFFINQSDLLDLNFSRVLYNWDCT